MVQPNIALISFSALSPKSKPTSQFSALIRLCINGSNLLCFAPTRGHPIFCERQQLPFQPRSCRAWMTLLTPSWQPPLIFPTILPAMWTGPDTLVPSNKSALASNRVVMGSLAPLWLSLQPCTQQSVHSPSGFTRSHTCLSETWTGYLTTPPDTCSFHVSMDSALAVLEQRWGFESTAACPQAERLDPASRTIPNVHGIVDWNPKLLPGQHHLVSLMKVNVRAAFLTSPTGLV